MKTLKIGDSSQISKTIIQEDLFKFADLSLDRNPVHLDPEYASKTVFKKPIAHGLYVSSFLSAVIANKLPGPGTIYLEQNLSFKKPVYVGDTVTARVEITDFPKPGLAALSTICTNQNSEVVIIGTALIKLPK